MFLLRLPLTSTSVTAPHLRATFSFEIPSSPPPEAAPGPSRVRRRGHNDFRPAPRERHDPPMGFGGALIRLDAIEERLPSPEPDGKGKGRRRQRLLRKSKSSRTISSTTIPPTISARACGLVLRVLAPPPCRASSRSRSPFLPPQETGPAKAQGQGQAEAEAEEARCGGEVRVGVPHRVGCMPARRSTGVGEREEGRDWGLILPQ